MMDLSVFITALEKVRFESLVVPYSIKDFEFGTPSYDLLKTLGCACIELSSIIEVMKLVSKDIHDDSGSCE